MYSRFNLRSIIVFLLFLVITCISCQKKEKPNILFIMADDHTSQAFGIYNSRLASLDPTPNLDKLASEGMIFDNVFCNNAICTPSRASIITGQYPQTNGVLDLTGRIPVERQYLPEEMRKLGYQTAMIGKWHLREEPGAFDYYNVLPNQGRYFDPTTREISKGEWPDNIVKHSGHSSDVLTDLSLKWLKNRDKSKPFFLMHHFKAPHDLFRNAKRYDSYLENVDIPEPESLYKPGNHGSISTRGVNDSLIHIIGASVSKRCNEWDLGERLNIDHSIPEPEYTHQVYQAFLKRYLRCVKGVDDNMGRIIDYLKEEGIYDNTIIIYTGDQGYFLGEHDYFDKRWMYEEAMRMPFFVRFPDMVKKGSRSDLLINNTDFAPTIIELAGGEAPDYMQGKSFSRTLSGKKESNWREATYYRYWMHMAHKLANPAHFGIRTKKYKLIFFYGTDYEDPPRTDYWGSQADIITPPGWEFYDLEKDPHEINNVYEDPQYADIIENLKQELKSVREELNETDEQYPHIQKIINEYWDK
ncbi:MAG: sulfatase [Deltaproteobacteria bacterium]|nr:sulfatase [Deltaproteobacteria bacterium]